MNAFSMGSASRGAISTDPVWCSCRWVPGVGGEVGQFGERQVDLDHAGPGLPVLDGRAIEAVRQVSPCRRGPGTRSSGAARGDDRRGADLPRRSPAPAAGGPAVADQDPGDLRAGPRSSRRWPSRTGQIAAATAPMPPFGEASSRCRGGWPPTSPIEWCAITYAVPGSYGLASGADHAVDRERALHLRRFEPARQAGRRWTSSHQPGHIGDRAGHVEAAGAGQASRSVAARSFGLREPIAGGTVSSSGPSTSASSASHASHFG